MGGAAALSGAMPSEDPFATAAELLEALPAYVFIQQDDASGFQKADRQGSRFSVKGVAVQLEQSGSSQAIRVAAGGQSLSRVILRWTLRLPADTLYLGDAWERSYGDLQWRFLQPERVMPWYFAAHQRDGNTFLAGVKTRPSALACWLVDGEGVSLWLDFRNGGSPAAPGDREIPAATILTLNAQAPETPLAALRRFCAAMCPSPRLLKGPVCGNNNWYYAYGRNFDAAAMLRDARFLAEVSEGEENRPFCVVDAGWTPGSSAPGGPWRAGDAQRFPDMPGLAASMKRAGVRPGIWIRPTALTKVDNPARLRAGPSHWEEKPLDLTIADNLSLIRDDVARIRSWGYELIKHDFSTFDIFGRWGFDMGVEMTESGWHFQDRTLTNAEIILRLYDTLRSAAGEGVLLGCNTMGHLGAGSFEVQRTGDDTSGREWERTRRMGINTLAYRLCQNGTFFACDPDCAAHTQHTPWELDEQYLELVAKSGTALFISVNPETVTADQRTLLKRAMKTALAGPSSQACAPVDWLYSTTPQTWKFGGEEKRFHWEPASGANPMRV